MKPYYKNIAVIGNGRIGQAIVSMLNSNGFNAMPYDIQPGHDRIPQKSDGSYDYSEAVDNADGVIAATPFNQNYFIAEECLKQGKAYFDLTEDVGVATQIKEAAKPYVKAGKVAWITPQCGLAPGAIGMIARHMMDEFETVHDVKLRVGALPRSARNVMKYYLTWSSEGLINEYIRPCQVRIDGVEKQVPALDGYELLTIDGQEYEAFYTSGGIGSLLEHRTNIALNVDYKTIRYPGHHSKMQFLLNDLGLRHKPSLAVELLNNSVPRTTDDVVIIYVEVTGQKAGVFKTETYHRKISGDNGFTAIQRATAAGVCTAVHYWSQFSYPTRNGFAPCEDIGAMELTDNPFWTIYAG